MSFINKINLFVVYSVYIEVPVYTWAFITNKFNFTFYLMLVIIIKWKMFIRNWLKKFFLFFCIIKFTSSNLMICHENVMKWNDFRIIWVSFAEWNKWILNPQNNKNKAHYMLRERLLNFWRTDISLYFGINLKLNTVMK